MQADINLNIRDMNAPIFRVFCLWHFEEMLRLRCLWLYPPHAWDDPQERLTSGIQLFDDRYTKILPVLPAYAQCWSATGDSDTLLRAYSHVAVDQGTGRNAYPAAEGVQVRTTPRKLGEACDYTTYASPERQSFYLGRVNYLDSQEQLYDAIHAEIDEHHLAAFTDPRRRAISLLWKRAAFQHENEVRLIYVERREPDRVEPRIQLRFENAANLIDEVRFDPRLGGDDRAERMAMLDRHGYRGSVGTWDEYQPCLLEIRVPDGTLGNGMTSE